MHAEIGKAVQPGRYLKTGARKATGITCLAALFLIVSTGWCATNISLTINSIITPPSNVVYNNSFQDWVVFGPTNNSYSPVGKSGVTNIGDLASDGTLGSATPMEVTASWTGGEPVATGSADAGGRFAPVGSSYTPPLCTWLSFPVTMPASSCAIDFYVKSYYMTSVLEVAVGQTTNTFMPGFPSGSNQYRRFQVTVSNATAGDTVNIKFKNFGNSGESTWNNIAILSASVTQAMPSITILGINGAAIASGEAASSAKGTDFGSLSWGNALTNTLAITNSGNTNLTISGVTTSGAGTSAFSIAGIPATVSAGGKSNFTVRFTPLNAGSYTAAVQIANNSTTTPYIVYLAGTAYQLSTNIGPYAGGNSVTITNGTLGNGSDITNVLVGGVSAAIVAQGANWVTIILPAAGSAGGKDIVIQSTSVGNTTLAGAYTYNPAGQIGIEDWTRWQEVAGLPAGRGGLAAGVLNGALYAVGGSIVIDSDAQTNVYRYDGTNWAEVAGLPVEKTYLAAGVLNSALYAFGFSTNAYRFDGTNWTAVAGLPASRWYLAGGVLNSALYAVGGWYSSTKTNVYQYYGTNWTETNSLPAPRYGLAAGVLNGALYAVGGADNGSSQTNVYRYNGTNWTEVASLPAARSALAAGVLNNALYAVGGWDSDAKTNVYRFDGTNWTEAAGLPAPRYLLAGDVLNGALYAVGGATNTSSESQTNVYRYPWLDPGVTPSSGSYTGGYPVTISGTNLGNGSDITNVTLCGVSVASIESQSATQVVAVAGVADPGQIGLGNVRVFSASFGETVKPNAFTYLMSVMSILGTNNAGIASGASASSAKGTDFGSLSWGNALTNTFSITNSGNTALTISGVTTSGAGASAFSIAGIPAAVSAGGKSNFTVSFTPLNAGTYTAAVQIANDSTTTPYIVYLAGTLNPAPVQDGWLAINVTPAGGNWHLTAPAGYTGPASGTGNLSAVSAVTGQYGVSYGALFGYVAPSNQAGFVTAGSTTLLAGVYLQISTNIGTPAGVSATEGTYTNRIRVIWHGVAGATGYEIWRSQTNDANTAGRIADIPEGAFLMVPSLATRTNNEKLTHPVLRPPLQRRGTKYDPLLGGDRGGSSDTKLSEQTYAYDDYAINPINAYYYWVRAKTATLISAMSYVGMGYAALSPDQKTGTADIGVSDLVYLPVNVTNLSHAGTVSCRLANNGPDALNAAAIGFDFHMASNATATVWIGSAQPRPPKPDAELVMEGEPRQERGKPAVYHAFSVVSQDTWIGSDQGLYTLAAGQETLVILTPQARRGLTVRGDLSGVQQVKVVVRHLSTLNDPNLANNTTTAAGSVRIKTSGVNSLGRSFNDYDGDGKADGTIYRGSDGRWAVDLSGYRYQVWVVTEAGLAGLTPVPGDYDGDGITDMAVYERSSGWWTVLLSSTEQIISGQFGGPEYTAAPCDFDGDAKTDPVVYRDADGYWYGASSAEGYVTKYAPGSWQGYCPVPGDYDGDGRADPTAYYNERTGIWVLGLSSMGYSLVTGVFGGPGWSAVSADYDGDGLTDPAIYDPSTAEWQVLLSGSLATQGIYTWWGGVAGNIGGIPVPADYDGDGKADPAVYHQATGIWELFLSANGYQLVWGGFGGPEYSPATE